MKKGNLISAALCAILAITIIVVASRYPSAEVYGTGVPGPGLWPICISVILLLCAVILKIRTLKMKSEDDVSLGLLSRGARRVYICMGILIAYVAVLNYLGFIISTLVMMFIFIQWFSKKKVPISILLSAGCTLTIYFVFKLLLNVPIDFGLFAL